MISWPKHLGIGRSRQKGRKDWAGETWGGKTMALFADLQTTVQIGMVR